MKRLLKMVVLSLIVLSFVLPNMALAEESNVPNDGNNVHHHHEKDCGKDVKLTQKQKKKLANLYDQVYKDKVKIIESLAEYGVITKEKKEKRIKWMKSHIEKVKKHDYQWCGHKSKKKMKR